jgi:hypothetical protein
MNEFYRSQANLVPTVSLLVAMIGVAAKSPVVPTHEGESSGLRHYTHQYYVSPDQVCTEQSDIGALRRFAESLLAKNEDSPQSVVDAINDRFWELI